MKIRNFTEKDLSLICSWWNAAGEPIPEQLEYFPPDTYILENEHGVPWVCLSLVPLHKPVVAWSMGLVSNPDLKEHRREAVKELWSFVANEAKRRGYKSLFCVAPNEFLEKRYQELGFISFKKNTTLMFKEI